MNKRRVSVTWILCRLRGARSADQEGWVAQERRQSLGTTSKSSEVSRARRGVPPDCVWLLYDIIRTDPERMVDVERSMRDAPR